MFDLTSIDDFELLRESVDLECKLAAGRDGRGAVPEDFWRTYSGFANANGGVVLLGVREKNGSFSIEGLNDPVKLRRELFDLLNNRRKVSANLLVDADVREVTIDGRTLIVVEIPRANRKQRPVHLTSNPFGNTFRRLNDGDRALADEDVRRMIAEQVEESRDTRIARGYELGDLYPETFRDYRQVFATREPGHPWNALPDAEFLRQIGGWRKDRETGESGLTLAGLLMFGSMSVIHEVLPYYMLDYQERPEEPEELRWVDRLTLDGKWSGNLYDFYRRVYLKLTADLKVPFVLEGGERKDETPVHVALREALANVLVHADYSDRASVRVVKRPAMFEFRHPGLMRIPPESAIHGGEHDCRNRTLHKMFRLVGIGEQAGSGIPKIYAGWAKQHWRAPALSERSEPYDQTLLELRMVDLLSPALLSSLRETYGAKFDLLEQNERLTLAAAASEKVVTHARVREMTGLHTFDASRMLQRLVQQQFLEAHNRGRGAVYCLTGAAIPTPESVFGMVHASGGETSSTDLSVSSPNKDTSSPHLGVSSPNKDVSSPNKDVSSPNKDVSSPNKDASSPNKGVSSPNKDTSSPNSRDKNGCFLSDQLPLPIVDDLGVLSSAFRRELEALAGVPRERKRVAPEILAEVILALCEGRFVVLRCLSELVRRQPETLREHYLQKLVRERKLSLAFPTTPTHERQAYCATASF